MPMLPESATTPSSTENAGSSVKVALDTTAFLSTALSMPTAMPARQLLTIKYTHIAQTIRIANATMAYSAGALML